MKFIWRKKVASAPGLQREGERKAARVDEKTYPSEDYERGKLYE